MLKSSGDIVCTILEYLPVGICIIDSDYVVHIWNSCMEQWTGVGRDTLIGTDLREHFPQVKKEIFQDRIESVFTGGTPAIFSSKIHTCIFDAPLPDGGVRRQQTTVLPVEHPSGYYAMFVCEDVTSLTDEIQAYRRMKDTALQELERRECAEYNLRVANEDMLAYISEATVRLKTPVSLIEESLREILHEMEEGISTTEDQTTALKMQIQVAASISLNLQELNDAIIAGKKEIPAAYRNMIQQ